jgi:phage gpG-like protein
MAVRFNNAKIISDAQKEVVKLVRESVTIMGVEAVKHYTLNFRKQGFVDETVEYWKPRKGGFYGGIAALRKRERMDSRRAILVKSGALRKSIRYYRSGLGQVTITSNLPYANAHNEGVIGRLPKRQFVGESRKLNSIIIKKLDKRIWEIFK